MKSGTKYVECKDCENMYDCERTYLGGCTDGKKWDKEMGKSEFYEKTKAFLEYKKAFRELEKAHYNLWLAEKPEGSWRNTKLIFWREICLKYDEKDLLNCYGDIFFVDERYGTTCIGRRILWNLELSKEKYEISYEYETDSDGDYEWTEYDIEVIKN